MFRAFLFYGCDFVIPYPPRLACGQVTFIQTDQSQVLWFRDEFKIKSRWKKNFNDDDDDGERSTAIITWYSFFNFHLLYFHIVKEMNTPPSVVGCCRFGSLVHLSIHISYREIMTIMLMLAWAFHASIFFWSFIAPLLDSMHLKDISSKNKPIKKNSHQI